jgi:hypothetical protein
LSFGQRKRGDSLTTHDTRKVALPQCLSANQAYRATAPALHRERKIGERIVHAPWRRIYELFRLTLLTMQGADTWRAFGIDGGCALAEPQYEREHCSHDH